MFPKDPVRELETTSRNTAPDQHRLRLHIFCLKTIYACGSVTEVLSLLYLRFAILSPSPALAEAGDGAVFGV